MARHKRGSRHQSPPPTSASQATERRRSRGRARQTGVKGGKQKSGHQHKTPKRGEEVKAAERRAATRNGASSPVWGQAVQHGTRRPVRKLGRPGSEPPRYRWLIQTGRQGTSNRVWQAHADALPIASQEGVVRCQIPRTPQRARLQDEVVQVVPETSSSRAAHPSNRRRQQGRGLTRQLSGLGGLAQQSPQHGPAMLHGSHGRKADQVPDLRSHWSTRRGGEQPDRGAGRSRPKGKT